MRARVEIEVDEHNFSAEVETDQSVSFNETLDVANTAVKDLVEKSRRTSDRIIEEELNRIKSISPHEAPRPIRDNPQA